MHSNEATTVYAVLRAARGCPAGFVRLESSLEQLRIFLCTETAADTLPLRLLMVSAGDDGAVLDLGQPSVSKEGAVRWEQHRPPEPLKRWDAVVLAQDWPSAALVAVGWLREAAAPLWRIREAIEQFLRFPPP